MRVVHLTGGVLTGALAIKFMPTPFIVVGVSHGALVCGRAAAGVGSPVGGRDALPHETAVS